MFGKLSVEAFGPGFGHGSHDSGGSGESRVHPFQRVQVRSHSPSWNNKVMMDTLSMRKRS